MNSYCLSMVSYSFLSGPQDVCMVFLWMSFAIPMIPDGFPWLFVVFYDFHGSSMLLLKLSHFPMLALWFSYDLHDFSMVFL